MCLFSLFFISIIVIKYCSCSMNYTKNIIFIIFKFYFNYGIITFLFEHNIKSALPVFANTYLLTRNYKVIDISQRILKEQKGLYRYN